MRIAPLVIVLLAVSLATLPALSSSTGDSQPHWGKTGPGVINHPLSVIPSDAVRIPAGWPLNASGAITCATCHANPFTGSLRTGPDSRMSDGDVGKSHSFCAFCHSDSDIKPTASRHWLAVGRAHVSAETTESTDGGRLDAESRQCLGCHDGVQAKEASYQLGGRGNGGSLLDRGRNHPVGIEYNEGPTHRRDAPLVHRSRLPKTIRLPGGNVGCVSCHNLYAGTPDYLSVPIEGSELCFTCHDMR